ncbi:MAG TPA: hypothetical protein VJR67_03565 [Candidatus Nitrosopolaris sp.]|nr:hypothetical protein [Candidatus Nitrosopolaris sp.]
MSEFLTAYPRRISVMKGLHDFIRNEEIQFDHLSLMVKIKKDEIVKTLISEGFRRVKLENKKPSQIGSGFAKKLMKPWEMHVRLLEVQQQGLIAIQAEVEISRRYIQHIRSTRAPVIYEIESILKKHRIEYRIWNAKVRDYIANIIDNHQIKLCAPKLPAMPWKPMLCFVITIAILDALKFMGIVQ